MNLALALKLSAGWSRELLTGRFGSQQGRLVHCFREFEMHGAALSCTINIPSHSRPKRKQKVQTFRWVVHFRKSSLRVRLRVFNVTRSN